MRAIDADALVNQCKEYSELLKFDGSTDREWATVKRIIHMLNDAPTIEPQRKKGKWLLVDGYRCSCCNYKLQTTGIPSRCPNPNCGAEMEGQDDSI